MARLISGSTVSGSLSPRRGARECVGGPETGQELDVLLPHVHLVAPLLFDEGQEGDEEERVEHAVVDEVGVGIDGSWIHAADFAQESACAYDEFLFGQDVAGRQGRAG